MYLFIIKRFYRLLFTLSFYIVALLLLYFFTVTLTLVNTLEILHMIIKYLHVVYI